MAPFAMLLEVKGRPLASLELGQLYLLGKEINRDKKKSKNFIELGEEEDVSQRHCVIETSHNKEAFVFDLFSSKGTLLNNQILNSLKKTILNDGDVLKVGKLEIKYIHKRCEESHDSSGFLEANKNTSGIISSSPYSTSDLQSRVKRSGDHEFLVPKRPSTSLSTRRSDSFTIPETQYSKPRHSLNGSELSIAESVHDSDGKVNFGFGILDSFESDDLCIPETQEVAPVGQTPLLLSNVQNKAKETSVSKEFSSKLENDEGSQFRICTQDYNEGFGEEESVGGLHSQIIPIIKHSPVALHNVLERSSTKIVNETSLNKEEKEMSALKWSDSKIDQETTEIRTDCLTPDIFDFEPVNKKKVCGNIEISSAERESNLIDEDEEDLLPTQALPTALKKFEEKKSLNGLEKPCFEEEKEDRLPLSDKENRCPGSSDTLGDLPPTQIFEFNAARSHTSVSRSNSVSSAITNTSKLENKNCPQLFNIENDEEDDLLTQAFLEPPRVSISSTSRNIPTGLLNSTLLDEICTKKDEMELTPLKQKPNTVAVFKKPGLELSFLKKNTSSSSTASENDVDLLMCTPQLIKDCISLEKTEGLRRHILAAKNKKLFGDETDDEDEDDQSDLVKLINVPKSSLDFDNLLPHLNRNAEQSKCNGENDDKKEIYKIHKFNLSFGKEQDEKPSKSSISKSSSLSRDERHAARDKERETAKLEGKSKANHVRYKAPSKRQEKKIEREEKDCELKEKKKQRELKEKESDNKREIKKTESSKNNKDLKSQKKAKAQSSNITPVDKEKKSTKTQEISTRPYKKESLDENERDGSKLENKQKQTPARRLTRSKSKLEEASSIPKMDCKDEDVNSLPKPNLKVTRSRSKSIQNDSQDSVASNISSQKNESQKIKKQSRRKLSNTDNATTKYTERKRKADSLPSEVPVKVELKRLRSVHSQESLAVVAPIVSVSMTMVDQELFKGLFNNAKGLWNIATNCTDCDILVMDKAFRTFKFLLAVARGIPIVTSEYLKKLNESKSTEEIRFSDYLFADAEFEKKYKFSLLKSLQAANNHKIFKDYEFLITASILPTPSEIKAIIEAAGGHVHNKNPPPPSENQNIYLVSAKEDKKHWHKYRRLNKNIIIVSTEAIMTAVMSQNCERMKMFTLS